MLQCSTTRRSSTTHSVGRLTLNEQQTAQGIGATLGSSPFIRSLDYSYDKAKHPHAPIEIVESGTSPNTHGYLVDASGNQTHVDLGGGATRTMRWDDENRLFRLEDYDGASTTVATRYVYDASGQRTHRLSTDHNSQRLYPNQWVSMRSGSNGGYSFALTTNHIYAGDQHVASRVIPTATPTYEEVFWQHSDHLSSTNLLTNDGGKATEHIEYFPYGEPWITENFAADPAATRPDPYLYTGKELDQESGLYYFGARYYDARTALWASADPILADYLDGAPNGGAFSPGNLGLYTYSYNSPVWIRDPDGRYGWIIAGAAVGVGTYLLTTPRSQWTARGAIAYGVGGGVAAASFGLAAGPGAGFATSMLAGAASGDIGYTATTVVGEGRLPTVGEHVQATSGGAVTGGLGHAAYNVGAGRGAVAPIQPQVAIPEPMSLDQLPLVRPRSLDTVEPVQTQSLGPNGFGTVAEGQPYLYVVDQAGQLRIAPRGDARTGIKHTQLSGGESVRAAGELQFGPNGSVVVNDQTGRYSGQSPGATVSVARALQQSGYQPRLTSDPIP